MMYQFGNGHKDPKDPYKNQYKEETSQIHAPTALLERTRLAVAEEESRLQAENVRKKQNRNYGRRYRWAFSVAAAAVLLLTVHGFVMLRGVGAEKISIDWGADRTTAGNGEEDGSMNGSAKGAAGGMEREEGSNVAAAGGEAMAEAAGESGGAAYGAGAVDSAILQSAPAKTEDSTSASGDLAEGISGGRTSGTAESSSLSRDAVESMGDTDMDDRYDDAAGSGSENEMKELEKKYSEEDSASQISVTEVDRKPDFCNRPSTKRIVSQGITFYVTESTAADGDGTADAARAEKDGWIAYAEYNGAKYVVTGGAVDQEDFLEKACEMLKEW